MLEWKASSSAQRFSSATPRQWRWLWRSWLGLLLLCFICAFRFLDCSLRNLQIEALLAFEDGHGATVNTEKKALHAIRKAHDNHRNHRNKHDRDSLQRKELTEKANAREKQKCDR